MKPRFSIRDLFWLTFMVAMALAWAIDRYRLTKDLTLERAVLKQAHQRVRMLESNEVFTRQGIKKLQDKLANNSNRIAELTKANNDNRQLFAEEIDKLSQRLKFYEADPRVDTTGKRF